MSAVEGHPDGDQGQAGGALDLDAHLLANGGCVPRAAFDDLAAELGDTQEALNDLRGAFAAYRNAHEPATHGATCDVYTTDPGPGPCDCAAGERTNASALCDGCGNVRTRVSGSPDGRSQFCPDCVEATS